jgi:hypothetical protein
VKWFARTDGVAFFQEGAKRRCQCEFFVFKDLRSFFLRSNCSCKFVIAFFARLDQEWLEGANLASLVSFLVSQAVFAFSWSSGVFSESLPDPTFLKIDAEIMYIDRSLL